MPAVEVDLKKTYRSLYSATTKPSFVEVPRLPFLYVDGRHDPASQGYADAVEALRTAAGEIRSTLKASQTLVYPVMPLEGLWWAADGDQLRAGIPRAAWAWRLMIMQPEQLGVDVLGEALSNAKRKKPEAPLDLVRLEKIDEGPSVQILHQGAFENETEAVSSLYEYAEQRGRRITGPHHEIYLSDQRRTPVGKLKTIVRYGVSRR